MLGFELSNTLSENGSVSRGICKVKDHTLIQVEEYTFIERVGKVIMGLNEAIKAKELKENELVSMNFWVLDPVFFEMAEKDLYIFLDNNDDLSTKEFYLPSVIDHAIQNKEVQVLVLPTSEKWFGLTYPGDKKGVIQEVLNRKEQGIYPESIWGSHSK